LLSSLPANVRSQPDFLPPSLLTKVAQAGLQGPPSPQDQGGGEQTGTPNQAVPMAQPQGPPNPAMGTLGNMMNRGAAVPPSTPALTPADQEPTMHSLISDLENSRQSLGTPAALTPFQRNFPNSTMFGVREAHRAHAQHQQAQESYNSVIRTIRDGDGDLTEAQKRSISEKMPSLPVPIQQRLRQYLANPRRGTAPTRAYRPGEEAYLSR
jgi:hypothetical protein